MVKNDNGEVMLEGIIIITMTLFLMLWLMSVGFIYYQKSVVCAITNDAAEKVAASYYYPAADFETGEITQEGILSRPLYRFDMMSDIINSSYQTDLVQENYTKVENYISKRIKQTNMFSTIKSYQVDLTHVEDSWYRHHVEVTVSCTFRPALGGVLDFFGMNGTPTYIFSARRDATDILQYITQVDYMVDLEGLSFVSSKTISLANKLIKATNDNYYMPS